ncbi:MAG: hypothetical protein NXI10_11875 [bacterium]|nr:hypothetical protein [bacterium]
MNNSYKELFRLNIIHHYFLDEGEDVYGVDMTAEQEALNLRLYNINEFFSILPSQRTVQKLKNWRSRFVPGKEGFTVLTKVSPDNANAPFIEFDNNLFFDFIIKIKDKNFENYTEIEIDRSKIVFISNAAPTAAAGDSETSTAIQHIALSDFGDPYSDMDIELVQDVGPNELIGAFGIIRIHLDGDVGEIDLSDGAGEFAASTPTPEMVFTNRETYWRYINTSDGTEAHTSSTKLPLTKNGYITEKKGSLELPNPTPDLIVLDSGDYYSEVFI